MSKIKQIEIIRSLNNVYLLLCKVDPSEDTYREYRIWLMDLIDSLQHKFKES